MEPLLKKEAPNDSNLILYAKAKRRERERERPKTEAGLGDTTLV